jgi:membrane-associated phospholipid phosphatase
VQSDEHYTSDVVAGAAIGIASSFYFTKKYKGFEIKPVADKGSYSVSISKMW